MRCRAVVFFCIAPILLGMTVSGMAQEYRDDTALALRYVERAREALDQGSLDRAEQILEAARDFADVSSDASYLLALVRMNQKRPAASILHAVKQARETARWSMFTDHDAVLIEARMLLQLRSFSELLDLLSSAETTEKTAYYQLRAYAGLKNVDAYMDKLRFILSAYPQDTQAISFHLRHAATRLPYPGEQVLMDRIISALPVLKQQDPSLSYLAAPFIMDSEYRQRLILEYRTLEENNPDSLAVSLEYGIIDELIAIRDLFAAANSDAGREEGLERKSLKAVWDTLRHEEGRRLYRQAAAVYSGWILEDEDVDGFYEARTQYSHGSIVHYEYDMDQDGLWDLSMDMNDSLPVRGRMILYSDKSSDAEAVPFSRPMSINDMRLAQLEWARYPYIEKVQVDNVSYYPAPNSFPLTPVRFVPLVSDSTDFPVLYPLRDSLLPRLTDRSLLSFANLVERPGRYGGGEQKDAVSIERIRFLDAVPLQSEEVYDGKTIAVTEFLQGRPYIQYIDLDLDGRMESRCRFSVPEEIPHDPLSFNAEKEFLESDWNGDGLYEYAEYYHPDSSMEKAWDTDGDGFRDRRERFIKE